MRCSLAAALSLTLLLAAPLAARGARGRPAPPLPLAEPAKGYTAAFVVAPTTGQVLVAENADRMLPTASMAKMMTCLIAMEQVRNGRFTLDTPVVISARASHMGGSQIYAHEGQQFPLRTLLAATMVQSANDAASAIAEAVAGSNEAFAELMNERARQLGLRHSVFYDPHGLPSSGDPQHVDQMSARDLARLAVELLEFPLMRELAALPSVPFTNGAFTVGLTNPNHLIQPGKRDYYPPADGVKTGFSEPAGFCITASAHQRGIHLIAVVMGARAPYGPRSSFGIAARLFQDAFAHHEMATVLRKGAVGGRLAVAGGSAATVPVAAAADLRLLVPLGSAGALRLSASGPRLAAPVRAGQPAGTIVVRHGDRELGRVPGVAGAAVAAQSWWRKLWPF